MKSVLGSFGRKNEEVRRDFATFLNNDIECQETQSGKIHFLRERWSTHILESLTTFFDADVRSGKRSDGVF